MHDTTMLKRIQAELVDELRRMSLLRAGFQAQHFSDEADAASHMEAAHIACCRARRSVQRIHDLERLLHLLRHNGPRQCVDCGEDIPLKRLVAAPGTVRCFSCQQQEERAAAPLAATVQRGTCIESWSLFC